MRSASAKEKNIIFQLLKSLALQFWIAVGLIRKFEAFIPSNELDEKLAWIRGGRMLAVRASIG